VIDETEISVLIHGRKEGRGEGEFAFPPAKETRKASLISARRGSLRGEHQDPHSTGAKRGVCSLSLGVSVERHSLSSFPLKKRRRWGGVEPSLLSLNKERNEGGCLGQRKPPYITEK